MPSADTTSTIFKIISTVAFTANAVNAVRQLVDTDVSFADPDDNFNGSRLTAMGLLAEDTVPIRDPGAGPGQNGFPLGNVSLDGMLIGVATGGAGASHTVTFNAAATAPVIDALIQNLTCKNASYTPTPSRSTEIEIIDAEGARVEHAARRPGTPEFVEQTGGEPERWRRSNGPKPLTDQSLLFRYLTGANSHAWQESLRSRSCQYQIGRGVAPRVRTYRATRSTAL